MAVLSPRKALDPLLASVKMDMAAGGITDFLITFPKALHSNKVIPKFSSAATRDILGARPGHGS
ncbi:hypothetical protein ACHAPQ_009821 [Fusarium lateritium]